MKYFFPFFIFIVFLQPVHAQLSTNVYWTDQTEMAASDVVYYNPAKPLVWQDFRGKPDPVGIVAAITSSGFGYKAAMKSNGGKGQLNIGVYCYFSKDKSWVKPNRKTDYILNHEQHHFDVSFIAASIFLDKLRNSVITSSNCNIVIPRIYKECCDLMNKLQDDYDGQTKNGQVKAVQEKWDIFLDGKIHAFTR